MKTIACLKDNHDMRVAMTPTDAKKYVQMGFNVCIEKNAGKKADYLDEMYETEGVEIKDRKELLKSDIILSVQGLDEKTEGLQFSINGKSGIVLSHLPRITRAQSMDVLSSQNNLAGYQAVIEGAMLSKRVMPLMMTSAGTIKPLRVLILGAGVAGLQAVATAKRLGAIVSVFDVRAAVKEQVESLNAKFIEVDYQESGEASGGYAKEMSEGYKKAQNEAIKNALKNIDIVITSALIPGKKAPILLTNDMVDVMKPYSVIVDLAGESGGNCEKSEWKKTVITENKVKIFCPKNILDHVARNASDFYSKNIYNFISTLFDKEKQEWKKEDELFSACFKSE